MQFTEKVLASKKEGAKENAKGGGMNQSRIE